MSVPESYVLYPLAVNEAAVQAPVQSGYAAKFKLAVTPTTGLTNEHIDCTSQVPDTSPPQGEYDVRQLLESTGPALPAAVPASLESPRSQQPGNAPAISGIDHLNQTRSFIGIDGMPMDYPEAQLTQVTINLRRHAGT